MADINTFKQDAYNATNSASDMSTGAPQLLTNLKQNLMGIFAKDNPIIQARNDALAQYLPAAAQSRADMLPGNMPSVEGRALTLSPTQQDALTQSSLASHLAPLAGYNEILKGMYGNIGDLVSGAGGIYNSQITAENNRANNLVDLYKTAVAQQQADTTSRTSGGYDLNSLITLLQGQQGISKPSAKDFFTGGGEQQNNQPKTPGIIESILNMFKPPAAQPHLNLGGSPNNTSITINGETFPISNPSAGYTPFSLNPKPTGINYQSLPMNTSGLGLSNFSPNFTGY